MNICRKHAVHRSQYVFTEASWVSQVQQLAAYDFVFHQLDQTQHHLWYSTCHCVCNPNANNTAQSHTVFMIQFTLYSADIVFFNWGEETNWCFICFTQLLDLQQTKTQLNEKYANIGTPNWYTDLENNFSWHYHSLALYFTCSWSIFICFITSTVSCIAFMDYGL